MSNAIHGLKYKNFVALCQRVALPANGAVLASYIMLTLVFRHLECCVPSEHELPRPKGSLLFVHSKFVVNESL